MKRKLWSSLSPFLRNPLKYHHKRDKAERGDRDMQRLGGSTYNCRSSEKAVG